MFLTVHCRYIVIINYISTSIYKSRYPYVCMLLTAGELAFSVAMVVLAFLSRPMFDTGGAEGHGRVKHL